MLLEIFTCMHLHAIHIHLKSMACITVLPVPLVRLVQLGQLGRPEQLGRLERPVRPEQLARPGRPEQPVRPGRPEQLARPVQRTRRPQLGQQQ